MTDFLKPILIPECMLGQALFAYTKELFKLFIQIFIDIIKNHVQAQVQALASLVKLKNQIFNA